MSFMFNMRYALISNKGRLDLSMHLTFSSPRISLSQTLPAITSCSENGF